MSKNKVWEKQNIFLNVGISHRMKAEFHSEMQVFPIIDKTLAQPVAVDSLREKGWTR